MNERIIKLGLESGMLNYVDHETPRHYFLCGNADEECLKKFAELIVQECADVGSKFSQAHPEDIRYQIKRHFGVEEPKGYQPTGWVCPKCGTDRTKAACPRGRGAATDGSCPMFGVAQ